MLWIPPTLAQKAHWEAVPLLGNGSPFSFDQVMRTLSVITLSLNNTASVNAKIKNCEEKQASSTGSWTRMKPFLMKPGGNLPIFW